MPRAQGFWLWGIGSLEQGRWLCWVLLCPVRVSVHPWGVEQLECLVQRHLLGHVVGMSQVLPQPPWAHLALQERADWGLTGPK